MNSLITFVIPTRNRQVCLRSMFDSFERFQSERPGRFDVVVLDNSDTDSLRGQLEEVSFPLKYFYSSEQLSVVENFNQGAAYISGEYACFIGDDDLISGRIFDLVELLRREEIDSAVVSPKTKCVYFWPGIKDARWGEVGGNLYLSECSGKVQFVDVPRAVVSSRRHLCDGPQKLPRAYSGIISKRCIDAVISRYGALFGGCSPDIYSSRLLASIVKSHVVVDMPILVAGAAKTSTSAARSERSDIGTLRNNDHLGRFKDLAWSPVIPEFYSPFTVWSQSYWEAEMRVSGQVELMSLAYLYAKCLVFARGNFKEVVRSMWRCPNKGVTIVLTAVNLAYVSLRYVVQKVPLFLNRRPGGSTHVIHEMTNSFDATTALDEFVKRVPLKLAKRKKNQE